MKSIQQKNNMASYLIFIFVLICLQLTTVISQGEKVIQYSLQEEMEVDYIVGDIVSDAGIQRDYTEEEFDNLHYIFLQSDDNALDFFKLDRDTGILRVATRIDRDILCPQELICSLKLDIAVQPPQYFKIIKVTIFILDINDNDPNFLDNHILRSIAENTSPGALIALPTADDIDSPKYGVKRYSLISSSTPFELKVTNNSDGSFDLHLVLRQEVDREERELYQVVLGAYDGGNPPKSGMLTIEIMISDVNDHHPVFDNETYEVTVPEDISIFVPIIRVQAFDPDAGTNGQVLYSLSTKTHHNLGNIFAINNVTGEIYTKSKLDYETNEMYSLSITARDRSTDSIPVSTKVTIHVKDINDNPPEVTVNALTVSGQVEISENADINYFVAHISVLDEDVGDNGKVICEMNAEHFELQRMFKTEFKIITSAELDRETAAEYDLPLICKDLGRPALTSSTLIHVTILDENDHTPAFKRSEYRVAIPENNRLGDFLLKVAATDPDAEDNGRVRYSIGDNSTQLVRIDERTGNLTAARQYDYEHMQNFVFQVFASDYGDPPNVASVNVFVTIFDENDELPTFTELSYSFAIYENEPVSSEVGQVEAFDADSDIFNKFTYSLENHKRVGEAFLIDPIDGRILTRKSLDRETQGTYHFNVMAISQGPYPTTSTVEVSVYVADRNDNHPIIKYPSKDNSTVTISNKAPIGQHIAKIIASDIDAGENAMLTYSILSGDDSYFYIDPSEGILSVASDIAGIDMEVFHMSIRVQDGGETKQTADTMLHVVVDKNVSPAGTSRMMSMQNVTIVIIVASISVILIIILAAAIFCIKMQERKRRQLRYTTHIVESQKIQNDLHKNEKQLETTYNGIQGQSKSNHNTGVVYPGSWENKTIQNGAYSAHRKNDQAKPCPSPTVPEETQETHRDDYPHYTISMLPNSKDFGEKIELQTCPQHKHLDYQRETMDEDSMNSADMSNADSGRGSEEIGPELTTFHPKYGRPNDPHNNRMAGIHLSPLTDTGIYYRYDSPREPRHNSERISNQSQDFGDKRGQGEGQHMSTNQYPSSHRFPMHNSDRHLDRRRYPLSNDKKSMNSERTQNDINSHHGIPPSKQKPKTVRWQEHEPNKDILDADDDLELPHLAASEV